MRETRGEGSVGEHSRLPTMAQYCARLPRLTLRLRLGLLSVVYAVPIALFAGLFIAHANQDIEAVRREIAGVVELGRSGPGPFAGEAEAAAAAEGAARVADRSGVTLDPKLNTYYLGQAVAIRQPQAMVAGARLRAAETRTGTAAGTAELDNARADLRAAVVQLQDALTRAGAAQGAARDRAALRQAATGLERALETHEARVAAGASRAARLRTLGRIEAAAASSRRTAHAQLETALTERRDRLRRQLALNLMVAALSVLVAVAIMIAIHGSVMRGVNRLGEVVSRLMDGDTEARIPYLRAGHEWGPLARALLAYRTALVEQTRLRDQALAAMRAKSEFLDNINHEIRTPLNGVIGVANALGRTSLDAEQRRMVELICASGRSVERLLSDVLDLSRLAEGGVQLEPAPFAPGATLAEAIALFAPTAADKGLRLELIAADDLPAQLEGDAARIGQVVANLVANAVKFTPAGGVSVTARAIAGEGADGVWLVVDVHDTGVGFDEAALPQLLGRFSQADPSSSRRFGGAGLGLSICKALLDLMGGTLSARSTPGEGSCFTVRMPLRSVEAAAPEPVKATTPGRPLDVLLVEDHPLNRQVVQLLLEPLGVRLTMAENGAVGVDRFREGRFDLVLMDIQMPVLDGLAATASIRDLERSRNAPRTPIVMLTANASPENRRAAADAGADGHLAKPVDHRELFNLVAAVA